MAEETSLLQNGRKLADARKDYFDELQLEMKRVTWPNLEAGASAPPRW